jgi:hypothetical protein
MRRSFQALIHAVNDANASTVQKAKTLLTYNWKSTDFDTVRSKACRIAYVKLAKRYGWREGAIVTRTLSTSM